VGKTLTGESIAEYLRCPLYAVSSGELGTSAAQLERDLNRIMDITHSWGAILLLDEADVFLEARQPHDIHRNALVSVFLRLTEYYQGILFLTTNRVATFDEAFQSRIHMGIRYENLTAKARRKIWMHHVGKVLEMGADEQNGENRCGGFVEEDYDELSKKVMNGRQVSGRNSPLLSLHSRWVLTSDRSRTPSRLARPSLSRRRASLAWSTSSASWMCMSRSKRI
jgi:SpoVK/Ycf46/Vps4 family AAA+-type ATPase